MKKFSIFVSACLISLCGCNYGANSRWVTLTNIQAVYLDEAQCVTLLESEEGWITPRTYCAAFGGYLHFVEDVKPQENTWATINTFEDGDGESVRNIVVHLHPHELQGGGWDHGKFGSGTVRRVE
jgi:hypothetical protein